MTIKRMFKFTLPALLFAAGVTAYAAGEGPILLKDGTTALTWQQFATALNNPSTIPGGTIDEAISTRLQTAKDAYWGVENDDKKPGAKKLADQAAAAVTAAQDAYDDANRNATEWQGQIASWNSQINKYNSERSDSVEKRSIYVAALAEYRSNLSDEKDNLKDLKDQLATLNASSKKIPGWLTAAYTNATNFKRAYDIFSVEEDEENYKDQAVVYYTFKQVKKTGTLTISFADSKPDGYTEETESKFYYTIDEYASKVATAVLTTFNVNVELNGTIINVGSAPSSAVQSVVSYITTKYNDPESKEDDPNANSEEKETLNGKIEASEKLIANYTKWISNLNDSKIKGDARDGLIALLDAKTASLKQSADNLQKQIDEVQPQLDALTTTKDEDGKTGLAKLRDAITTAKSNQATADADAATAKEELDAAQKEYDDAVAKASAGALANYKEVTLTGDVTVDEKITDDFKDGVINGNGHVISLGDGVGSVFNTFSGTLVEVAVNGKFSTGNNNAVFNSVAYWYGTGGKYYDVDGKLKKASDNTETFKTLGELAYIGREFYGADFANGKLTSLKTDPSTIAYYITVYNSPTSNTKYYVTVNDNAQFVGSNNNIVTIPTNMFAKSSDSDIQEREGLTNVIYTVEGNNICDNVVIEDRVDFYSPVDFTAANVDYSRKFTKGMNVTCLPFELKRGYSEHIANICEYDRESIDKFYFTSVEGTIEANKPALIVGGDNTPSDGFKLAVSNVTFKATPATQIVKEDARDNGSVAYGTFKKANLEQFDGEFSKFKFYSLGTNKQFLSAIDSSVFPAFRMVIESNLYNERKPAEAPRRIVIVDENGVEITEGETTGIDIVEVNDASSLNIVGGQGQIIITSDADYGTVPVYAIDGKLVGQAEVVAGETVTVDVQKGIYIVLGKKVLVK